MPETAAAPLLEIDGLSIAYPISIGTVRAVDRVTLSVRKGEVLGIVGESGCGKSTLGLSILKLLKAPGRITAGAIRFKGRDVLAMSERELLELRGRDIAMIFQSPLTSLDPLMSVKRHFIETMRAHESGISEKEAIERAGDILVDLGIDRSRLGEFPYQLSGGMRQRIMIGLGLILHPEILLADEPTTALDVIVEAGFTELLVKLKRRYDLTVLLISHNLGLVAEIADRIAVMYGGRLVELAPVGDIFEEPLHPYTRGLMDCVPNILLDRKELVAMPGSPPSLVDQGPGCPFAPRCPKAMEVCGSKDPAVAERKGRGEGLDRSVACWLYEGEA
jgi:peptide/nickel transport system ATP-binding protein